MTFNALQLAFLFANVYVLIWLACNAFRLAFGINYIVQVKYDGGNLQKKFVIKAFSKTGAYVRAVKLFCKNNNIVEDIYKINVQTADNPL